MNEAQCAYKMTGKVDMCHIYEHVVHEIRLQCREWSVDES